MNTLHLFEIEEVVIEAVDTTRAYCPRCRDFTVLQKTLMCELCGEGLDRHYDFVDVGDED